MGEFIDVGKEISTWHREHGTNFRVSPGVEWCPRGNRIIAGTNVKLDVSGSESTIGDQVMLGSSSEIRRQVVIGDNSALDDRVFLSSYTRVGSVVVICSNTRVHDHAVIGDGCVVGAHSRIGNYTEIGAGLRLKNNTTVSEGLLIPNVSSQDVFNVQGQSGYQLTCFCDEDKRLMVKAGCVGPLSLDEFMKTKEGVPGREKTLLARDYIKARAEYNGWHI